MLTESLALLSLSPGCGRELDPGIGDVVLFPGSAARASAVARYFVEQGVRAERVSAVGYGENHPIATNATPEGRAANGRVVVVIARRAGGSRNLNADPGMSAFAVVRGAQAPEMDPNVVQVRTPEGGLRFTNEAPEEASEAGR